jgi:hypothetical protein
MEVKIGQSHFDLNLVPDVQEGRAPQQAALGPMKA